MRKALPILLILVLLACAASACVSDARPELSTVLTPSPSPSPLPDAFRAEITAVPQPTDDLGRPVVTDSHYQRYLSFGDLRVFEYGEDTFLDGVCWNTYSLPIEAEIRITYYDDDDRVIGEGTLHTADGGHVFPSGSSRIYAEIRTDTDLKMEDFVLEYLHEPEPRPSAS